MENGRTQALMLHADCFASTFDLHAHHILQDVHTLLVPDAQSIRARLHQLNVYGPGPRVVVDKVLPTSTLRSTCIENNMRCALKREIRCKQTLQCLQVRSNSLCIYRM